jgi:hypothetical protein
MIAEREKLFEALRAPFPREIVDFRPQASTADGTRALALPYVDVRHYYDRLDEVLGAGNWSVVALQDLPAVGGLGLVLSITLPGSDEDEQPPSTITRAAAASGGRASSSDTAAETAESFAFKRACAQLGLGRYLYALKKVWCEGEKDQRGKVQLKPNAAAQFWAAVDKAAAAGANGGAPTGATSETTGAPASAEQPLCPRCRLQGREPQTLRKRQAGEHNGKAYPAFWACPLRQVCKYTFNAPNEWGAWSAERVGLYLMVVAIELPRLCTMASGQPDTEAATAWLRNRWDVAAAADLSDDQLRLSLEEFSTMEDRELAGYRGDVDPSFADEEPPPFDDQLPEGY